MAKKQITYTETLGEIEQILERFRSDQMDVDTLAQEVKRATELITLCKERLTKVEKEVEQLFVEQ